jgi:hypothetical protein
MIEIGRNRPGPAIMKKAKEYETGRIRFKTNSVLKHPGLLETGKNRPAMPPAFIKPN